MTFWACTLLQSYDSPKHGIPWVTVVEHTALHLANDAQPEHEAIFITESS